jgi:AcrR family transcriptional regulator
MKGSKSSRAQQGEATRARILAAARQRFASDGYERATIRAIAADAGIDPSLVMRYFTNKQGLFVAAADIDLRLPELHGVPRERVGVVLVEHFLDRWQEDDILQALLRTAATNKRAAERMRKIWSTQPGPALAAATVNSKPATRAALINGLFLGFAYARFILELPPLTTMSRADAVTWLAPIVQRYLYHTP